MKIFGHRGAAGLVAENTLESITEALKHYVDGIEIDIHRCKSGEFVVIHDETLNRTTNGIGNIADYSLMELSAMTTKEGFLIPTLEQVLEVTKGQCLLNIELKGKGTELSLIHLLEKYLVSSYWKADQFILSSFDHSKLEELRKQTSAFKIGVLTEENITEVLPIAEKLKAYSIHPPIHSLTYEEIKIAKSKGYQVYVWTVNSKTLIKKAKGWNIDAVITDFPNFAR